MATVLLAHSYFLRLDPKQWSKMRPYPPLATLHAAAHVRANGHDVAVFDAMLAEDESAFAERLAVERPRFVVLHEDNFNFLSKMCLARMREAALTMVAMARAAGCRVAVTGSDVTDHPEVYLDGGAEVCLLGEAEHQLLALLDHWAGRGPDPLRLDRPGFAWRQADGAEHSTGRSSVERHPDVFGRPARDLVDIDAYRDAWVQAHGRFSLNVVATRGCPYRCNWCAKPIWGQRYSMRSPRDVAEELADVKRRYAPDHIWFVDDIFGLRSDWLAEFADAVRELDAVIPFTVQSRCDLMNEQAVAALARAGCAEVWLGAESGSQKVLDAMDKDITVGQIREAIARLQAHGVRACCFVQLGYPGEMWEDVEATLALLLDTLPDDIGVSVSYPLPGTPFHEMVRAQLHGDGHWSDSGDLAMMFAGTFTTEVYRDLHLALHDVLDLRRREAGLDRARHPSLPDVAVDLHRERVLDRWADLRARAAARHSRSERPTRLRIPVIVEASA